MFKSLRLSAWLPPGLALGWLAILATLVHNLAVALADWGATVSSVMLFFLLVLLLSRRRQPSPRGAFPGNATGQPVSTGSAATATATASVIPSGAEANSGGETQVPIAPGSPSRAPEMPPHAPTPAAASASARPGTAGDVTTRHQPRPSPVVSPIVSELRVLTAGQVALAFGVEEGLVIDAISNGQLPGNQFGGRWLVHQGTLVHWLRGSYREPAAEDPGALSG
jgi:hypothetical protein